MTDELSQDPNPTPLTPTDLPEAPRDQAESLSEAQPGTPEEVSAPTAGLSPREAPDGSGPSPASPGEQPAPSSGGGAPAEPTKKGSDLDRERWLQIAHANAEVIRAEIEKLRAHIQADAPVSFAEFWAHAREITSMFKTFKPLEAKDREALWNDFHGFCEATRAFQEGERAKTREESAKKRAHIEAAIQAAEACLSPECPEADLDRAQALLNDALNLMKTNPGSGPAPSEEGGAPPAETLDARLVREDREACWAKWVEVREVIKSRRKAVRGKILSALRERAESLLAQAEGEDPHGVQTAIRTFQTEVKESSLSPAEKERVRGILRAAWRKSSERIEALKVERKQKHHEWLDRMVEHLTRWETAFYKNQDLKAKIESEIADLERRLGASKDSAGAEKLRGWVEEKRKRLAGVDATGKELSEKIRTVRAKMGKDAPPPVPPPEPKPAAERPPRREKPEARPSAPPPSAGLNLGDVLSEKLGAALQSLKRAEG
ncbi:MAG: hypothetical protein ACOYXN_03790 [Acidobacteriota bacterium]